MTGYLLDTNVISELRKKTPIQKVVNFIESIPSENLFASVLTIGEIRRGIEKTKDYPKKLELQNWLQFELFSWFDKNILLINHEIAEKWGVITTTQQLPAIDSLLAATALVHNLALVTRNITDFQVPGLEVVNPF